jgi:hypothetical protein
MNPEHFPNTPRCHTAAIRQLGRDWGGSVSRLESAFLATGAKLRRSFCPTEDRPERVPPALVRAGERPARNESEIEVVMVELRSLTSDRRLATE